MKTFEVTEILQVQITRRQVAKTESEAKTASWRQNVNFKWPNGIVGLHMISQNTVEVPKEKFTVCIQRWVEETALVEIEAEGAEGAAILVDNSDVYQNTSIVWTKTGAIEREGVYKVHDAADKFVWEPPEAR